LGVLLSEQERFEDAIPELRRAISLDPDLAQAHYRLARAYQRTGQQALAAEELKKFTQLKGRAR
jgi:Flp pilus assembly protein TadD